MEVQRIYLFSNNFSNNFFSASMKIQMTLLKVYYSMDGAVFLTYENPKDVPEEDFSLLLLEF